jgi:hypothetical protein
MPPVTLEEKIVAAAELSEKVVEIFSPAAAKLVETGVALEPVLSGFVHLIAGIFKHHTK